MFWALFLTCFGHVSALFLTCFRNVYTLLFFFRKKHASENHMLEIIKYSAHFRTALQRMKSSVCIYAFFVFIDGWYVLCILSFFATALKIDRRQRRTFQFFSIFCPFSSRFWFCVFRRLRSELQNAAFFFWRNDIVFSTFQAFRKGPKIPGDLHAADLENVVMENYKNLVPEQSVEQQSKD